MMERSECLQHLHELQQTERQAAAEALKHRQNLETVLSEKKGLTDRLQLLETDNAKLSAENIQVSCPLLFVVSFVVCVYRLGLCSRVVHATSGALPRIAPCVCRIHQRLMSRCA